MSQSTADQLTARFYEWEQRGRGWYTFDFPIEIEPDFFPFLGHYVRQQSAIDDSKRHTIFSAIGSLFAPKQKPYDRDDYLLEIPQATGRIFDCEEELIAYRITVPKNEKLDMRDMEQLLLMLSDTTYPVSFEILANSKTISLQFVCRESDSGNLYGQVQAYFPAAILTEHEAGRMLLADGQQICAVDFGLQDEFMRPIATADDTSQDPFIGLFGALERLRGDERAAIQVLFKGAVCPWSESIMRSVTDNKGGSFFADDPDMVKLAKEKISAPLFGVCIRIAGQADEGDRAVDIAKGISAAVIRLTSSESNALRYLPQDNYPPDDIVQDMFMRQSHRSGMLLNSNELATLVHFPSADIASQKLEREARKTKHAPTSAHGHKLVLGLNEHHGSKELVSVPAHLRLKHTHIIGATGTGKSTLLQSMIVQDMQHGNGIAVLDPHGDLIESILGYVPEHRIQDVIVIDPADGEYPVGFNILSAHSEIEKDILSSDLVAAFRRLSTSWGDQMNSVFANAILAFLESSQGGTLVDLRRFLIEKPFRDEYLKSVSDPHITYYWTHEYPLLKSSSIGSILTRLDTFLRPKLIRNMVAQKKGLDFENILDTKKILLIKLSQGLIGAENSFLLGTFFVSKMYQAAMARQAKSKEARSDYFLYIDEFHHYATPSLSHILSGARKYGLGLILAHQDMAQVQKHDTELASSVVVNAGTRICFRLGDTDAKRFASGFSYFEAEDLENLRTGEAIARIEKPDFDFNLSTIPLPALDDNKRDRILHAVIAQSRQTYGTPKALVEEGLNHTSKLAPIVPDNKQAIPIPETTELVVQDIPTIPVTQTFTEASIASAKKSLSRKVETQHRYLQKLIKQMAQSRGYKATLEETTPDGAGRVDVSLERDGKRIACEISVTTDDTWEVHNVQKCLAAGYDEVIVCSDNAGNLERIRKQIEDMIPHDMQGKVFAMQSQEVIQYFDSQRMPMANSEKIVKGYKIKVEYQKPF